MIFFVWLLCDARLPPNKPPSGQSKKVRLGLRNNNNNNNNRHQSERGPTTEL